MFVILHIFSIISINIINKWYELHNNLIAADCPHPTCSGHGFCAEGTCICKKGWKGPDCAVMDQEALQCLPDCSGHGTFDLDTQICTCEQRWSGEDCSKGKYLI